jgi:hypothetical protein
VGPGRCSAGIGPSRRMRSAVPRGSGPPAVLRRSGRGPLRGPRAWPGTGGPLRHEERRSAPPEETSPGRPPHAGGGPARGARWPRRRS